MRLNAGRYIVDVGCSALARIPHSILPKLTYGVSQAGSDTLAEILLGVGLQ